MKLQFTGKAATGLIFACSVLSAANAQNTNSGEIRGTITDSSGAIIPGATVEVKDVDKGQVHTYTTDGAGLYDTGSIVPDHYLITVSRDGFQTYVRGPITLDVSTVVIDAALSIGTTAQQVIVNTDVALLQTDSGAQSATLDSKQLLQLPQVGADWQNFVTLLPGASTTVENNRGGQAAAINGNLPYSTVLADGATTTLPMSSNSDVMVLDTVSEVKVNDSAFSAQYGIGGVTFNQISKGGTNSFHGDAYEYFQNDAMNAAAYAFGASGASVSFLRYNNFGGSVGGPIWKNKMFFYFNYDKTINDGASNTSFVSVPTAAMRAGDFTGLATIYDPTTQTVDAHGVLHRKSFAEEYPGNGNKIPAALLDPVAQKAMSYFPGPNTAPTPYKAPNGIQYNTNNFAYTAPSQNPFIKYFGRLDYSVNDNNHLIISETESDNPAQFLNTGICPVNCQHGDVSRDNAQISEVWTISPNLINEARIGFTDQFNFYTPFSAGEGYPAKLGLKFAKADTFPGLYIGGNVDWFGGNLQAQSNAVYKEMVFDPSDVVTLIRGRHVLHFGGEFLISRADSTAWGNENSGNFNFNGLYTADNVGRSGVDGEGLADFLLGYSQTWSANVSPEFGARIKVPQLFAQDDIKLTPTLTINAGLRWQGSTGWDEVKGNMASFDPTVVNPTNNSLGAMWYGTTKANGRERLIKNVWDTFLPRVGFSYQLHPDAVIRGGFGLYGYTWSEDTYGAGMGGALSASGNLGDNTNGINPVVILNSDGNTNYQGSGGKSVNAAYVTAPTTPDALNGQGVSYQAYHTPVPKIMQWNLQVQQTLGKDMVASLAYVGSHGYDLLFPVDINQVPEGRLSPNDASGATNARPYPNFQGIGGGGSGGTNNSTSNYNSLQAVIQKRLSYGLQYNVNYVWSHMLDTIDSSAWGSSAGTLGYQNSYNPGANYGPSNFDVRNSIKGSAIYDLPVGKGRQFLNSNALLDELIGGWQVAPSIIWSTGSPFTPYVGNNNSYAQAGTWYPNMVSSPIPAHRTIQNWYNTAAFATPAVGTFGNERRNQLYGPDYFLPNLALGKTFNVTERVHVEIRGEAENVLNHPSFGFPNENLSSGGSNITSTTVGGRTMQLFGKVSF
jgi:hypothetical protein